MTTETRERIELACVGAYIDQKGKLTHKFRVLASPHTLQKEVHAWEKVSGNAGGVYSVEIASQEAFREKGSIFPATMRWVRRWDGEDDILRWQAEARAAYVELEARRKTEKEKASLNELRKRLLPLRKVYARTNPAGKTALIAVVIRELQRHPLEDEGSKWGDE